MADGEETDCCVVVVVVGVGKFRFCGRSRFAGGEPSAGKELNFTAGRSLPTIGEKKKSDDAAGWLRHDRNTGVAGLGNNVVGLVIETEERPMTRGDSPCEFVSYFDDSCSKQLARHSCCPSESVVHRRDSNTCSCDAVVFASCSPSLLARTSSRRRMRRRDYEVDIVAGQLCTATLVPWDSFSDSRSTVILCLQ